MDDKIYKQIKRANRLAAIEERTPLRLRPLKSASPKKTIINSGSGFISFFLDFVPEVVCFASVYHANIKILSTTPS